MGSILSKEGTGSLSLFAFVCFGVWFISSFFVCVWFCVLCFLVFCLFWVEVSFCSFTLCRKQFLNLFFSLEIKLILL